ncbi:MAG: c-type cytochrome [Calothrix sp. SM1_5_4]|nr:c-type cytochrome [Calothrix sp. SM1_5_4]
MSNENDILIENHEYDGIQEYDNPLPNWWMMTFLGAIIFGFIYWVHYEFGGGATLRQELQSDMAQVESLKKNAPQPVETEEELQKLLASAPVLEEGKQLYNAKCAACHGAQLQGLIGPNLTDEYWLHGEGTLLGIAQVIRKGVLDKGMPNWDTQLKSTEIKAVTAYVASAKGTNPPNPKAPQGEKFVRN